MDAPVAIPDARLADFLDPHLDSSLIRPPGLVVVGGRVDAHPGHDLSQTSRLQS